MSLLRIKGYSSEFPLNLTRGFLNGKKFCFLFLPFECSKCFPGLLNPYWGAFQNPAYLKNHALPVLYCFSLLFLLLCVVPLGFFFFCVPLSGWLLWSSPVLCFVELASITAVFPLSPVLGQKLGRLVNVQDWSPPTARGWWRQWGCYVSLWLEYM